MKMVNLYLDQEEPLTILIDYKVKNWFHDDGPTSGRSSSSQQLIHQVLLNSDKIIDTERYPYRLTSQQTYDSSPEHECVWYIKQVITYSTMMMFVLWRWILLRKLYLHMLSYQHTLINGQDLCKGAIMLINWSYVDGSQINMNKHLSDWASEGAYIIV